MPRSLERPVLVTAAAGYVGGRLVPALCRAGYAVRAAARHPEDLEGAVPEGVEVRKADVLDPAGIAAALHGVDTAFYLVHSMASGSGFAALDRRAASTFADAAAAAGIRRVVYLGGLGDDSRASSVHLTSRHETGRILAASGVPTVEFRASVVIGRGSLSYGMIRTIVERFPVIAVPSWAATPTQPIAADDVVSYLVAALALRAGESRVYEIGGPDVLPYEDLLQVCAASLGLRRRIVHVPFFGPGAWGRLLYVVAPRYAPVGRHLVASLVSPTVLTDDRAARDFPDIVPMGIVEAFDRARSDSDPRAGPAAG